MAIPDFQSLLLPVLRFASDGAEHSLQEAREQLAKDLRISAEDRQMQLTSVRQSVFDNRVSWAKIYLQQARLLDAPRRGIFMISDRGRQVLAENPSRIDLKLLERFPEFVEF
jgi:restriction system protein